MYTVYGKDGCKHCKSAVELLESKGLAFEYLLVGTDIQLDELVSIVETVTGERPKTIPQIFNNNYYIGGFVELKASF